MQRISLYQFRDRWIISIFDQTDMGVWKMKQAFLAEEPYERKALGLQLLEALAKSVQGIPHPDPYANPNPHTDPALEQSGVKSRSTFMKTAKLVKVVRTGKDLTIEAWKNCGPRGGFEPFDAPKHIVSADDPEAIGAAVHQAMEEAA